MAPASEMPPLHLPLPSFLRRITHPRPPAGVLASGGAIAVARVIARSHGFDEIAAVLGDATPISNALRLHQHLDRMHDAMRAHALSVLPPPAPGPPNERRPMQRPSRLANSAKPTAPWSSRLPAIPSRTGRVATTWSMGATAAETSGQAGLLLSAPPGSA